MSETSDPVRDTAERKVKAVVATFFNVAPESIGDSTVVGDVEGWDSTTHVGLILAIEEELGIEFGVERITSFQNVGELIDASAELMTSKT